MGSIHGYNSEKLKHSAEKKITNLALFEDLLDYSGPNVDGDSCPSDCESGVSGPENEQPIRASENGLIRIYNGEMVHEIIKKKLVSSLSGYRFDVGVEAIHRSDYSSIMSRAKLQSFCIYSKAMEMKCGGNANVKYAWYGAPKNEIDRILSYGFGFPTSNRGQGHGIHLFPVDHPVESMQLADPDEGGLRHMLLCRVILGKMEKVCLNSEQYNPSCEEFDSGVDDLDSPKKYIVWNSRMNTHVLPEFVVSFRASSYYRENPRNSQPLKRPNSDWMPFPTLINALSKFLPSDAVESITNHHDDYKKQKVTRHEMIQRVRLIAGDQLLMAIIKSFRGKMKTSRSSGSSSLDELKRSI